jgi:stalled ribosome rescue protein Dom34
MQTNHVAIWIDHKEARILYFDASKNEFIKSDSDHHHLHHKANAIGSGKTPIDHEFFHKVISAVASVKEILVLGPGSAKAELLKHAAAHDPVAFRAIVGVETTVTV